LQQARLGEQEQSGLHAVMAPERIPGKRKTLPEREGMKQAISP